MYKKLSFLWFIMGLVGQLQVLFSLSMTEILILVMAPCLVFAEIPHMQRTGVIKFFWISILLFCGCVVSLIVNHAQFYQVIRGVSITGLIVCSTVVMHYMLRNCPQGVKWHFVGGMLSGIICIFVFQRSVEVTAAGGADVDTIMSGKMFWIQRLSSVVLTPLLAFYLRMPFAYCVGAPLFLAFFSILTSTSGRSASLSFLGAAAIVMIGGKKRKTMIRLGKHFALICKLLAFFF